jgi:hypothetical protein
MSLEPHIADAEKTYLVVNVPPDFCKVGSKVVPFDIVRELKMEKADYAKTVFARSEAVVMVESITKGIKGNAGRGVISGVSRGEGHVKILKGAGTVFVENRAAARHNDLCLMNGQVEAPPPKEENFRGVEE